MVCPSLTIKLWSKSKAENVPYAEEDRKSDWP